jgi:hypothetical protein
MCHAMICDGLAFFNGKCLLERNYYMYGEEKERRGESHDDDDSANKSWAPLIAAQLSAGLPGRSYT